MIRLADVCLDSDLSEDFTILRTTGAFGQGGWMANAQTSIPAKGVVTVARETELAMVPEGDRIAGAMAFYTPTPLYLTSEVSANISDVLVWRVQNWRVLAVSPWNSFGFNIAVAVKIGPDVLSGVEPIPFGDAVAISNPITIRLQDTAKQEHLVVGSAPVGFVSDLSKADLIAIRAENGSMRYTVDGTTPTQIWGQLVNALDTFDVVGNSQCVNFQAIQSDVGTGDLYAIIYSHP